MKSLKTMLMTLPMLLVITGTSLAFPALQLDIAGGFYDWDTKTVITNSTSFTLYAYLIPDANNTISDTYYISAALTPSVAFSPSGYEFSSFSINGTQIQATRDMDYGTPPLDEALMFNRLRNPRDAEDLGKHAIYPTYFHEMALEFGGSQTAKYSTIIRAGQGPIYEGTGMYYVAFNIDTSALGSGVGLHFDLYNEAMKETGDIDISSFAPFSHDAEYKVPEPSAVMLMGSGLIGLAFFRSRRK